MAQSPFMTKTRRRRYTPHAIDCKDLWKCNSVWNTRSELLKQRWTSYITRLRGSLLLIIGTLPSSSRIRWAENRLYTDSTGPVAKGWCIASSNNCFFLWTELTSLNTKFIQSNLHLSEIKLIWHAEKTIPQTRPNPDRASVFTNDLDSLYQNTTCKAAQMNSNGRMTSVSTLHDWPTRKSGLRIPCNKASWDRPYSPYRDWTNVMSLTVTCSMSRSRASYYRNRLDNQERALDTGLDHQVRPSSPRMQCPVSVLFPYCPLAYQGRKMERCDLMYREIKKRFDRYWTWWTW